ncbi:hypothetical protein F5B20DRAFT_554064 [Whalleya microplaca]|nr:hypothetical protein F5B20DRAFT_554064 [Whalleya microplaca]
MSNIQMDADAAAARQHFVVEAWTLLSIGLSFTIVRTIARVKQFGFKGLQADDYLAWIGMIFYAIETSLAYWAVVVIKGLANNGMTDEQRLNLDPGSTEYKSRVVGSKILLAGWPTYLSLLWSLKASLLLFYIRLTSGLYQSYIIRIYIGFGLIMASFLAATLTLFLTCRPFHKYWQIYPEPGNKCQPAISNRVVWVYGSMNIITDLYLISIPVPMLWQSSLRPLKKSWLIVLFSGGIFITVCAVIRAALIVTNPVNGAQLAGSWAVRETFVAVIMTNLPMVFPFINSTLTPILGPLVRSILTLSDRLSTKVPKSIRTWGQGNDQSWRGRGPRTPNPIPEVTLCESEECMLDEGRIELHNLRSGNPSTVTAHDGNRSSSDKNKIQKDEVTVISMTSSSASSQQPQGQDTSACHKMSV